MMVFENTSYDLSRKKYCYCLGKNKNSILAVNWDDATDGKKCNEMPNNVYKKCSSKTLSIQKTGHTIGLITSSFE